MSRTYGEFKTDKQPLTPATYFMAATTPAFIRFQRRLLSLAIASTPAALAAQSGNQATEQWDCQPAGDQWQCERRALPGSTHPATVAATALTQSSIPSTTNTRQSNWDWIPKAQLEDPSVCKTGCDGAYITPNADWPEADKDPATSPMRAAAASSKLVNNIATLEGGVVVSQGYRRLVADQVSLDRNNNQLVAEGNIELREPNLLVQANRVEFNTNTNLGLFNQARFLQHESQMRGSAELIERNGVSTLDLERAMVTQCPPDDEVWKINAGSIHLDNEEGWGSAKHARINIKDVPVFYAPYLTFPIDDRRKSGFLWPSLASSNSNGFEITAPYYLNLAPNYDATIAPRYIEKRGLMTELELRQLSRFGQWQLSGAYLNDDQYKEDATPEEDTPPQEERWVGSALHSGQIGVITTLVDYTEVSDDDFFSDLSTNSLELKRTTHLSQKGALGYSNEQWLTQLLVQDYQTIDDDLSGQYQFMPRLSIERYRTGANFAIDWLFDAEFTQFEHRESWDDGGRFTTGDRAYGEVGASYPMRWAAGFVTPTAKVRHISYNLDAISPGADDTPSATSPLGTLDMGLIFERDAGGYLQTLEPRLYYFYSDFEEQTGNPGFDTRELDFSYSQLFRDTRFAGHDRIDDANQLSVGITSRYIEDAVGREVLSLSLGQIFYFDDRRVQLNNPAPEDTLSNSNIAGEIQYQPQDNLWLSQTLLWDSRQDKIEEGGLGFHYQSSSNSLYNLGYRFRRDGQRSVTGEVLDLSQVDASLAMPIADRWNVYARYRYDLQEHRSVDDMVGLRYEDCCWAVNLVYQRGIDDEYLDEFTGKPVVDRDHIFVLEFQLKGLGSLGSKASGILRENILGYEDLDQ